MKFILSIVLFFLHFCLFAQETTEFEQKKVSISSHLNLGGKYFQSFDISNNLMRDGLSNLDNLFAPSINFDISVRKKRLHFVWSSGIAATSRKEENHKYRFMSAETGGSLTYAILGNNKSSFSVGSLLNVSSNSLSIFSTDATFSLNSINPINQTGSLEIYYIPVRTGLMLEWSSYSNEGLPKNVDIIFTYQRVINSPKWQSDYADVQDTINETGQNLLSLSLRLYLFGRNYN